MIRRQYVIRTSPAEGGSWWIGVRPGDMTVTAQREQERMNRSKESRCISSLPEQMNYLKTHVE